MDAFFSATERLPEFIKTPLRNAGTRVPGQIQEIRLRSGRRPALVCQGVAGVTDQLPPLSHTQLQQCFYALCGNSVHTYQHQIAEGFFTLPGGHRVGVAGAASLDESGRVLCLKTITSLNIRIARNVRVSLPDNLKKMLLQEGGLLLAGPPGSGKTTLLRSIAHFLSDQERQIAVVDERCELMPCTQQGFCIAPPLYCDVLSAIPKAEAIRMALRSLSPDVILCDELGGMQDVDALEQGLYAGVDFVASIHGKDFCSLRRRPQFARLLGLGAFRYGVFLEGSQRPGTIQKMEVLRE